MPSKAHRTNSKSGSSAKSTKTPASSRRPGNSSPPATASFVQVFGEAREKNPELVRTERLLAAAETRLECHEKNPEPRNAILRTRYRHTLGRYKKHVKDLHEYLALLKKGDTAA